MLLGRSLHSSKLSFQQLTESCGLGAVQISLEGKLKRGRYACFWFTAAHKKFWHIMGVQEMFGGN